MMKLTLLPISSNRTFDLPPLNKITLAFLFARFLGANQTNKYYTWSAAGQLESIEKAGKLYYPVRNRQGDIVTVLDETGNAVATYTYDSTGQIEISPYRYAGYRYDEAINFYSYF